jgi:protein-tyrosine phosphatase
MNKALFLCSGNYYRSRFAEIYFNWHADQLGLNWRAESRGLIMMNDNAGPMSRAATTRLGHHGISTDAYQRFPQKVTLQDMEAAQLIVAMKRSEHHYAIQNYFPTQLARVEFWEIHDLDCAQPEEMFPQLEQAVMTLVERLESERVERVSCDVRM